MGRKRKNSRQIREDPLPPQPPPVQEEDSEDEEIDEDEAFNSDDERKYGSFFNKEGNEESGDHSEDDDNDDDEELSDNDDELEDEGSEDGDGGKYMLDLLEKLSGPGNQSSNGDNNVDDEHDDDNRKLAAHVKESEFSSSVVKPAGLTLDSLMETIKDTKGFGALAKTMKHVASNKATTSPLHRIAQDRLERKVHYEKQAKHISGWTHVVQENRQAESLDFRPPGRLNVTKDMMVDSFQPRTDFEKELDTALEEAGQKSEEDILKAEEKALTDDLGANKITLEQFKQRRGQLAKMRALMFYHEQKRHHINKIKSKKYRRIRKRQRERLREAEAEENPEMAEELKEKEEVERIKERMTLAHKNTSKWAKRVLKRGKNVDVDTRRALSAQLKRGDDLLKKMKGDSDDDGDSEEDLTESARKVLEDPDDDNNEAIQGKGLFKLAFMQRGVEKARQKAKEEARQLLIELEADEDGEMNSASESEEARPAKKKKKLKAASKKEMKDVLGEGDMVAIGLTFGGPTSLSLSGAIDVGIEKTSSTVSEHNTKVAGAKADEKDATMKHHQKSKKVKQKEAQASQVTSMDEEAEEEANPWMVGDPTTKKLKKKSKQQVTIVNVDRAVDLMGPVANEKPEKLEPSGATGDGSKKMTALTQEELVRKAFATDEQEADEEFAQEKERVREEEENPTRKTKARAKERDSSTAGWGSWTGAGAPPPPPKKQRFPKGLHPPVAQQKARPRQDDKKQNVIIREKRLKQLADKHMLQEIPHPFSSREEYERAMMGGIGKEWNVNSSFKEMTRPAIVTQSGKIIQPIASTAKKRKLRPAAKF